jgi:3-isopropylmalate/(R)-2-methylmalate dehydratase small subunit
MTMKPFELLTSPCVLLPVNNIDTDQIIPGRFLKTTTKKGLGEQLFADWRYAPDGSPKPDFPLNQKGAEKSQILVAGNNFGCGSSREHAPWALADFGFRAVISTRFADIFRNNSLKNGLLPVVLPEKAHHALVELLKSQPEAQITISLPDQAVILPDESSFEFEIDAFNKHCLIKGIDQLGYLFDHMALIEEYETVHPPRINTKTAIAAG